MSKIKWILLALLAMVIVDATGDALRVQGHQVAHHVMETLQVGGWIAIWALFGFNPVYIAMYILGRLWAFDPVLNLLAGNPLLYMGENDLVGRTVHWFADLVKQNYIHFSFMLKLLSLIWWVAWFWTNRTFKPFKYGNNVGN